MPEEQITAMLSEMRELLSSMLEAQKNMHAENSARSKHVVEVTDETADNVRALRELAFPGGDADGHRRYHQAIIDEKEARKNLWLDLRSELVKKGVWAFIIMAGTAFWFWFKSRVSS